MDPLRRDRFSFREVMEVVCDSCGEPGPECQCGGGGDKRNLGKTPPTTPLRSVSNPLADDETPNNSAPSTPKRVSLPHAFSPSLSGRS
eukprot:EC715058.1.p3 GENE.EC715058.1~~EC715058.1.p3  ORF type:complete len:88 (+),score=2.38 EC715058.1:83-346(+)